MMKSKIIGQPKSRTLTDDNDPGTGVSRVTSYCGVVIVSFYRYHAPMLFTL